MGNVNDSVCAMKGDDLTLDVIDIKEIEHGILQITMQDRIHKNTFSPELMAGLIEAFRIAGASPKYKAVILTGYDTYFASGGTKEGLLAIHEGRVKFTDTNVYSLALDCPIPVIAAMQGHGIGGGLVMGLFADFVVMSRESVYTTNFMKYGFTPGMGATLIVPRKLGPVLGGEMLLSGASYRGADLEKRGIPYLVLPRGEVAAYALQLARDLAEKPRVSLVALKEHLVGPIRRELPQFVAQEVSMHELTFHQSEVKQRIEELFGQ